MDVKSICIVGGGSAGWMTAATLCKFTPNIKVTLIESSEVGVIGVGESTLGHFNNFLNAMEIKDEDWDIKKLCYELSNRRHKTKTICYVESHD